MYSGVDKDFLIIPAFTNQSGKVSKLETFCSNEWKARVCDRWLRKKVGIKKFIPWFGFSTDEPRRFNAKRRSMGDGVWFPLVDGVPQNKIECEAGVMVFGWPRPKHSACYHCPLQSDAEWLDNTPEDQAKAIQIDNEIRLRDPNVFLHRSCKPLSEVKFKMGIDGVPKEPCDSGLCYL